MKRFLALLLSIILLLSVVPSVAFAGMEYADTYETALNLAKNDLTNLDNLNDAVAMLGQLGSFSFSRRYVIYFQQMVDIQGGAPDFERAKLALELCQKDDSFAADLAERGLPSCSELVTYIGAREREAAGDLENLRTAYDMYSRLSLLDAPDRAFELALKIASVTPESAPTPTPVPAQTPVRSDSETGDINVITCGSYEQDNNPDNGTEPIEWLVLEVQGDRALLISRYALDCRRFHSTNESVTWETCDLRKWLNDSFLRDAFSAEEQKMIPKVTVEADMDLSLRTPGNNTQDKVFLLSFNEVNRYFKNDVVRRCEATAYAKANGCSVNSMLGTCWWWLRTPGHSSDSTRSVSSDGSVYTNGRIVDRSDVAVRPAMWINLAS